MQLTGILHSLQLTELGYDTGERMEPNHRNALREPFRGILELQVQMYFHTE